MAQGEEDIRFPRAASPFYAERGLPIAPAQMVTVPQCEFEFSVCMDRVKAYLSLCLSLTAGGLAACLAICAATPDPMTKAVCVAICVGGLVLDIAICKYYYDIGVSGCLSGRANCYRNFCAPYYGR